MASEPAPSALETSHMHSTTEPLGGGTAAEATRGSVTFGASISNDLPGQVAAVQPDPSNGPPTTSQTEIAWDGGGAQRIAHIPQVVAQPASELSRQKGVASANLGTGLPSTASGSGALPRSQTVFNVRTRLSPKQSDRSSS